MRALCGVAFTASVAACAGTAPDPESPSEPAGDVGARFEAEAREFLRASLEFAPHRAVTLGYEDYAGALPDPSEEAASAEVERLTVAVDRFAVYDEYELSPRNRAERAAIVAAARRGLLDLELLHAPERDPSYHLRALDLSTYANVPYAPVAARAEAAVQICAGAGAYLEAAKARISDEAPRPRIDAARATARQMIAYLEGEVAGALAGEGEDLASGLGRCVDALEDYATFLDERREAAPADAPLLHREGLASIFAAEGLAELIDAHREAAKAAIARDRELLERAAAEIDPELSLAEVIEFERMNVPAPDELFTVVRHQLDEMRALVSDRGAMPPPSEIGVEVREAPPHLRDRHASLRAPGAGESRDVPAILYLTRPDPSWSETEAQDFAQSIGDLLATSIREGWPGRLHHALAASTGSEVLSAFCPEATRGGWAHYAEGALWEVGLADGDPRVHAALLISAIVRNLRVLTVIDVHTGEMTVGEAAARFEREALVEPIVARIEAARAAYDPAYATHALGRLDIETLRAEWEERAGEGASPRDFHDAFFTQGCAPLNTIRAELLDRR